MPSNGRSAQPCALCPEILARLPARFRLLRGGGPDHRHRTLYDAVQWSFDLLEPTEQQLLARLSVFRGGCDLVAATQIAGAPGADELDILDALDALVARSVVVADVGATPTRYGMLETLRVFAAQQLAEPDATATAARHADYYLELAEWAADALLGNEPVRARHDFEHEWDNLRAAVDWTTASGDFERAVRLVLASYAYGSRARRHEVGDWCERVLRLPGADEHADWSALAAAGANLRRDAGDLAGAEELATRAMAHDEARGGPRFDSLIAAFRMAWSHGQLPDATALIAPLQASAAVERRRDAVPIANYLRTITALAAGTEDPIAVAEEAWDRARRSRRPYALRSVSSLPTSRSATAIAARTCSTRCGGGRRPSATRCARTTPRCGWLSGEPTTRT